MAFSPSFALTRAEDQLVLQVSVSNLQPQLRPGAPNGYDLKLVVGAAQGHLWVQFPPQQLLENAARGASPRLVQTKPIFTPPSDVVLVVRPSDGPIDLSVAGILAAISRLEIVPGEQGGAVDPLDARPPRPATSAYHLVAAAMAGQVGRPTDPAAAADRRQDRAARRAAVSPPRSGGTSSARAADASLVAVPPPGFPQASQFRLPYLLNLQSPGGHVRLRHAAAARVNAGRTALWSTRLEVTSVDFSASAEVPLAARFTHTPQSSAPQPGWADDVNDARLKNTLRADLGVEISEQSRTIAPATVQRLALSSLGGWLRVRGDWPDPPPGSTPEQIAATVAQWRHDTSMGRDQAQRIVVVGRLYPFGHRAIFTEETVRRFESGSTRVAALRTAATILVTDPQMPFVPPATAVADVGGDAHRRWPFTRVDVVTTVTPPLEAVQPPGGMTGSRVLRLDAATPFAYQLVGYDHEGSPVPFALPLLFVPGTASDAQARALWNTLGGGAQVPENVFRTIQTGGQPMAVAPMPEPASAATRSATGSAADLEVPTPEQATTVLTRKVDLALDAATGLPVAQQIVGRIAALDRYAPGAKEAVLQYAAPYTQALFDGANAQGQVFLKLIGESPAVGLAQEATGGLAALTLSTSAISRQFGALAGADLTTLAAGAMDLSFLKDADKLLGLARIKDLLPTDEGIVRELGKAYKMVSDLVDGVASQVMTWDTKLFGDKPQARFHQGFVVLRPLRKNPGDANKALLRITQTTEVDTARLETRSTSECLVEQVELQIHSTTTPAFDTVPLLSVPIRSIRFTSRDAGKPDVDIKLGALRYGQVLAFIATLAEVIDQEGFSDPPALTVTPTGVRSGFSFPVPSLAIGVFALENIAISAGAELNFTGDPYPLSFDLGFSTPDNPFRLTIAALGGGGHLAIGVATTGLIKLVGALEFGASLSVDLFVARGSVEAMGGVLFDIDASKDIARIGGYFRIRGEVEVLSIISVSITLTLTLDYDLDSNELYGYAEIAVEIKVLFFSESVVVPMERRFAGPSADPTFAQLMAPTGRPGPRPWDTYCAAFAQE
ncbi:hypothetical protein [Micromonospora sp. NPDC049274]|uniref:hypothetical protein n=1 Tax=Micromonospora sp. NPDC049274 TaxID=3154829 RepID=UPI003426CDB7